MPLRWMPFGAISNTRQLGTARIAGRTNSTAVLILPRRRDEHLLGGHEGFEGLKNHNALVHMRPPMRTRRHLGSLPRAGVRVTDQATTPVEQQMAQKIAQQIAQQIANELGVRTQQVAAAVELLDGGATVPFVARYRKEATGALDDTQLRTLDERLKYLRELEERREA